MQFKIGDIVEGKIVSLKDYGAFVALPGDKTGMVHISEVSDSYIKEIKDVLNVGDTAKVKILSVSDDGKIALSIKRAVPSTQKTAPANRKSAPPVTKPQNSPDPGWVPQDSGSDAFEAMLNKFKATSSERISGLKNKNGDVKRSRRGGK